MKKLAILLLVTTSFISFSQSKLAAKFDTNTMSFAGTKTEQAKYLLRPVKKGANLGSILNVLPSFLDKISKDSLKVVQIESLKIYLNKNKILENEIGGEINLPLSSTSKGVVANYFVIHDASNFIAKATSFPTNINDKNWSENNLLKYAKFENAHLFINRLGQSLTSNKFNKKIKGTKFENKIKNPTIKEECIGNFIHIELIQPRISDKGTKNDAIAPIPGFTGEQYKKLALIYIITSSRKGEWLIPTFHAVLDDGIKGGHDDPQNFEVDKFSKEIESTYNEINSKNNF